MKGKTKPQVTAGRKRPLTEYGMWEQPPESAPREKPHVCSSPTCKRKPQVAAGHPEGSKALQALVDTVLREPKAEEPREADCTTPETCGICHRCQKPEPHDCTVQVPRDLYERAVGMLDKAARLLDGQRPAGHEAWLALRSVLADLKALGGM